MYIESMMPSNHLSLFLLFQSFPASGSFPMSQLFISGDQTTGASASALVFPMNIQDWFALGLTGWISLQSKELERVFSITTLQKHQFFSALPSWWSNFYIRTWLLEKSGCCDLYFYVLSPKLRAQTGRERNKKKFRNMFNFRGCEFQFMTRSYLYVCSFRHSLRLQSMLYTHSWAWGTSDAWASFLLDQCV